MTEAEEWTTQVERMGPDDLRLLALSLPVIEQAKGILMGHYGCDAATAFTVLQRWSSLHQRKLRDLAAELVAEATGDLRTPEDDLGPSSVERFVRSHRLG